VCSTHKRKRAKARIDGILSVARPKPPYRIKFLTLTIPNTDTIRGGIDVLRTSFKKLRNTKRWKRLVRGGLYVIEVKRGKQGWHPHLHILMESRYYKWEQLLKQWMRCSPGRGVWIEDVPTKQAVSYITKYVNKAPASITDTREYSYDLRGTRMFQTFGTWHTIEADLPRPRYKCPDCGQSCWMVVWDTIDAITMRAGAP